MKAQLLEDVDGYELVIERKLPHRGTLQSRTRWAEEPTYQELTKALDIVESWDTEEIPPGGTSLQRMILPLGLGEITFGHDWGPPTWWLPHATIRRKRNGILVGVGWLSHAFTISWRPNY